MSNDAVITPVPELKEYRHFAKSSIAVIGQYTVRPRKIQRPVLRNMMINPYLNWIGLQGISSLMIANNGNYNRLVQYFGTMSNYDHILYPHSMTGAVAQKNGFGDSYEKACHLLQQMNLKHNCRWWGKRLIEQGELYIYKIQDKNGIIYQEMPSFLCRVNRTTNGKLLFEMDLAQMDIILLATMPLEIQNIYQQYVDGTYKYQWYNVSELGVAFNMWGNSLPHGFPFLSFLFDKLLAVEDFEDMNEDLTKVDNLKLIHQTIPTDPKNGEVLMDEELASIYHNATKRNLPKGVTIATNPLSMEVVNLQTSGNENARGINYVVNALNSVYNGAGVNSNIFNGEVNNPILNQAGIVADEQIAMDIVLMFQTYINSDLMNQPLKGTVWQIKMLDSTCFNKDIKIAQSMANLSVGGSKMDFLATSGYSPLEAVQTLRLEQELNFSGLLTPVQTSYTMSGSDEQQNTQGQYGSSLQSQQDAQAKQQAQQQQQQLAEQGAMKDVQKGTERVLEKAMINTDEVTMG